MAAFQDESYFQEARQKVMETREKITEKLKDLNFQVIPSKANFIFISHPIIAAEQIYQQLREQGILVRYFKKPRIDNFLRVSIGTDEEMKSFLQRITEILKNYK
jgi:histidinol-phosphate aminotransferase